MNTLSSDSQRFQDSVQKLLTAKPSPAQRKEPVKTHRAQKRNTKKG